MSCNKTDKQQDTAETCAADDFFAVPYDTEIVMSENLTDCVQPSLQGMRDVSVSAEDTTARHCVPQPIHGHQADSAASGDAAACPRKQKSALLEPQKSKEKEPLHAEHTGCEPLPACLRQEDPVPVGNEQKNHEHSHGPQREKVFDSSEAGYQDPSLAESEMIPTSSERGQSLSDGLEHKSITAQSRSQNDEMRSPEDASQGPAAEVFLEEANVVHTLKVVMHELQLQSPNQTSLIEDDETICWLQYTFSGDAQVGHQEITASVTFPELLQGITLSCQDRPFLWIVLHLASEISEELPTCLACKPEIAPRLQYKDCRLQFLLV